MAKKIDLWGRLYGGLSASAQARLSRYRDKLQASADLSIPVNPLQSTELTTPQLELQAAAAGLSPRARLAQLSAAVSADLDTVEESEGYFLLIEIPNGDVPAVRKFLKPEDLALRMQSKAGSDMFLVPVYGRYLPHSTDYLFLSDGDAVTISGSGKPDRFEVFPDEVTLRSDNYVGPPGMLEPLFDEEPYVDAEEEAPETVFDDDDDDEFYEEEDDFPS